MSDRNVGFRPDIQGIRGLAVLLVVLYHSGGILPAGFIGVDIFFVISGFVIMKSVERRIADGHPFSIWDFLGRRVRRLFPALALLLSATMLMTPWFGTFSSRTQTFRTGIFSSVSAANLFLYRFRPEGYFETKEKANALLHLWSLAVEEQFYIFFAVLAALVGFGLRGRKGQLNFKVVLVILGTISLALCLFLGKRDVVLPRALVRIFGSESLGADFSFYLPFTRAWEFVSGILLAAATSRIYFLRASRLRQFCVVSLLVASCLVVSESRAFPGLQALLPVVLTVLLIGQAPVGGFPAVLLRSKILRWIGDRSYSWYLWHWPLIQFINPVAPGNKAVLLTAGLFGLIPAHLSFKYFEQFFIRQKLRRVSSFGLLALPIFVSTVLLVTLPTYAAELNVHFDAENGCESGSLEDLQRESACTVEIENSIGQAILLGDSHAGQLSEGFIAAAGKLGLDATVATRAGKPLFVADGSPMRAGDDELVDAVINSKPLVVVIAQSRYPTLLADGVDWSKAFSPVVDRFVAAGIKVVVVDTAVFIYIEPRECSVFSIFINRCEASVIAKRSSVIQYVRDALDEERAAVGQTGATVVDLIDVFCGKDECPSRRKGKWMWRDSSHMSIYASELAAPKLEAAMSSVINGS